MSRRSGTLRSTVQCDGCGQYLCAGDHAIILDGDEIACSTSCADELDGEGDS